MEQHAAHWGPLDEALLFDPDRYGVYARAHHIAGHHWALWACALPMCSAGLSGRAVMLPWHLEYRRAEVEATGILAEALGIEALVAAINDEGFGPGFEVDQTALGDHVYAAQADAIRSGCHSGDAVEALLDDEQWMSRTQFALLTTWACVAGLADAMGRGHVLEADQVRGFLHEPDEPDEPGQGQPEAGESSW